MQTKIKDPAFLAEYDAPEVDRSRHPELYACDWLEQIGSYLKYGLLDADVLLDVTSTSINRLWNQLAPAIERMRVTRGDGLCTRTLSIGRQKGRLWAKAHPGGAYPRNMPRMRDLKGVGVGPGTIFRPAIFGDTQNNAESAFRRQHLSFRIGHSRGRTLSARASITPRATDVLARRFPARSRRSA